MCAGEMACNQGVFSFGVVASPLHDPSAVEEIVSGYTSLLARLGGRRSDAAPSPVTVVATGGTEQILMDRWGGAGAPLVLVAHPGHNSLPAALEALGRVQQLGGRGVISYLDGPGDAAGAAHLDAWLSDLEVWRRLHETRIGLVGDPSDWLVASTPDEATVRGAWGPDVVRVPIEALVAGHSPDPSVSAPSGERTPDDVAAAAGVTPVLRTLIAEHRLDAVTVRCFDLIGALGTTGCLALSALNDDGMVAGCEGDVVSTIGMMWAAAVTGEVPWMANPARLSRHDGTIVLAHCTVPSTLVESVRFDSHFESGIGVGISGDLEPGPVTVLRIGGRGLDRIWIVEGEVSSSGDDPGMCRTQATVRIGARAADELLRHPLGNHLVLVRGHHEAALRRYHGWLVAARD